MLPTTHPLRLAATKLEQAFRAVTTGPVSDDALSLTEISHQSPLAPWKSLVRAITSLYRGDDRACEQWLEQVAADSAPARLVPALSLEDQGYSAKTASRFSSVLLASSLCGRVLVGYVADRWSKKNVMVVFYFFVGASILLLGRVHQPSALWSFVLIFGFSMGADYMLIPLVTAECFGTASLGRLLALIIMGYSLGQWAAPWIVGRVFETQSSYNLAWRVVSAAGLLGAAAIYGISPRQKKLEVV